MKKVISILLIICTLTCCLISCGHETTTTFSGKWIWKAYPDNPIYMYLDFSGQNVRYGTSLYGEDVEAVTYNCTYKVDGTTLTLTSEKGKVYVFSIQYVNGTPKFVDEDGYEFIYVE